MKSSIKYLFTITILLLSIISIAWSFYLSNNSTMKPPKKAQLVYDITVLDWRLKV